MAIKEALFHLSRSLRQFSNLTVGLDRDFENASWMLGEWTDVPSFLHL